MAHKYTLFLLLFFCSHLSMGTVVHAQANRPLEVVSTDADSASSSTDSGVDPMVNLARKMAQRQSGPLNAPAVEKTAASPTTQTSASTTQTQTQSSQPATAAATPVAPVVPQAANERKPLGPSNDLPMDGRDAPNINSGWGVTQTLMALAVVVGLILVARQLLIRWTGRPAAVNRSRAVEVLSRISVGPRQHVVLLRMGGRILVVADSAGQMRPLANIDEPEEVASILKSVTTSKPTSISQGFGHLLGKFDREYDQEPDALRIEEEGQDQAEFQVDKTRDQLNGLLARVRAMAGRGQS